MNTSQPLAPRSLMTRPLPHFWLRLASLGLLAAILAFAMARQHAVLAVAVSIGLAVTALGLVPWPPAQMPAKALGGALEKVGVLASYLVLSLIYLVAIIPLSMLLKRRVQREFSVEGRSAGWCDVERPINFERMF